MPGTLRSGLLALVAWMAIGVCLAELVERRRDVWSLLEENREAWMGSSSTGEKSYVSESLRQYGE
jgi:hypothetical protein